MCILLLRSCALNLPDHLVHGPGYSFQKSDEYGIHVCQIENELHKATSLGATMRESSDEAMAEVRAHLLAQQDKDVELRATISDLTNNLSR